MEKTYWAVYTECGILCWDDRQAMIYETEDLAKEQAAQGFGDEVVVRVRIVVEEE